MNKHIELVKKWLDNPESVTQEELEDNRAAAYVDAVAAAYVDAVAAANAYAAAYAAADVAAYTAADAAADVAYYAAAYTAAVKHWVKRYEELKAQGE